ncbi:MAG: HAD family hydrolase [Oceanospirillaceae bacterium]|nr:HAD family hydrolase [Oceanospirillaceae bacterium]
MKITGILFDKDGTLIDFMASWMPAITEAANYFANNEPDIVDEMLSASGYNKHNHSIAAGSLLAAANNQQIADCWSQFLEIEADSKMLAKLDQIFQHHNFRSCVAVTDLPSLFDELRSRGIKLGLATSDSEQGAKKTLQALNVTQQLDFVCGYDSGFGIKPEAGMVQAFCKATGLDVQHIMVVGDNTHDLHMAHNAGAKLAVGVLTGTSKAVNLHEADYILDNIADIPELLDNIL